MDEIFNQIRSILTDKMGVDFASVTEDNTLTGDLGLDSIELTEFCLELEEVFNVEIEDSEVTQDMTVGQVCEKIGELKG